MARERRVAGENWRTEHQTWADQNGLGMSFVEVAPGSHRSNIYGTQIIVPLREKDIEHLLSVGKSQGWPKDRSRLARQIIDLAAKHSAAGEDPAFGYGGIKLGSEFVQIIAMGDRYSDIAAQSHRLPRGNGFMSHDEFEHAVEKSNEVQQAFEVEMLALDVTGAEISPHNFGIGQ